MMASFRRAMCLGLVAGGLALANPASAQERMAIGDRESYSHPHSGIVIPARVGGIDRIAAIAFGANDLDVGMSFEEGGEALSVYVFRDTSGAVPVWFAQAQTAVEQREQYYSPELAIGPVAFTPPAQANASGLQAIYDVTQGPYDSTGVAMFAIGRWYVKVRASSTTRSPEELSAWINAVIGELTLPAGDAPAVEMVQSCDEPLRFEGAARSAPGEMLENATESIFGGMLISMRRDDSQAGAANWCLDRQLGGVQAIYRENGSQSSYLIALTDSGVALTIGPERVEFEESEDPVGREGIFTIHLNTSGRLTAFTSQDRLPSPQDVMRVVQSEEPYGHAATWGDERQVDLSPIVMQQGP